MLELFNNPKYSTFINEVKTYYKQPHRYFHDWSHINGGIRLAAALAPTAPEFDLTMGQQLAWLMHDIVYLPRVSNNEKHSVQLMNLLIGQFRRQFSDFDLEQYSSEAETIIMATASRAVVNDKCRAVFDLDMSCFVDKRALKQANADIITEFNLPDASGRIQFLVSLLSTNLYCTEYARLNWEVRAKSNIESSIAYLEKSL